MAGHVFVVQGDMRRLASDAWLLPCDANLYVVPHWLEPPETAHASDPVRDYLASVRDYFEPASVDVRDMSASVYRGRDERLLRVGDWGSGAGRVAELVAWTPEAGPRPWLVDFGGHSRRPVAWYLAGLLAYLTRVERALTGPGAPAPRNRRARPLVACHAIGTGYGGARWRKARIIWPQLELLEQFVRRPECEIDVVLVAWEESTFAAAQACRRTNLRPAWESEEPPDLDEAATLRRFWPELSSSLIALGDQLAQRAAENNLVLFLGAGVSSAAGLPSWGRLLEEEANQHTALQSRLPALQELDLLDQAQLIERHAPQLRERIAQRLQSAQCALGHALLASLPVDEAVTQNYDRLFEVAAEAAHRPVAVIPGSEATDAKRWLLKMHGSVGRPAEIVLTRGDYLRYADRRAALAGIVQAMLITKHMLFVGFSLRDPNFHGIADDVRKVLRPDAEESAAPPFGTVLLLEADDLREQLWEGDLELQSCASGGGIAESARRLDIFLDYLLYRATTSSCYLLDPNYAHALSHDELALRDALEALWRFSEPLAGSPAWLSVERLLRELGSGDPDA